MDKLKFSSPISVKEAREFVKNRMFTLYYQPIVSIDDGKIVGAEALARLVVDGKVYSPYIFLDAIKSDITLLETFERELFPKHLQACHIFYQHGFKEPINYNISARHLNRAGCALSLINQYLKYSKYINTIIEITEQESIENSYTTRDNLDLLTNSFKLYIDDFGTGYANLHYIINYKFSGLKVDKSFVDNISVDTKSLILLKGIIPTVKNLGITTVAEGVESEEQLNIIKDIGFNKGQGYYWGEPLDINQFITCYQLLNMSEECFAKAYNELQKKEANNFSVLLHKAKILNRYCESMKAKGVIK